MSTGLSIAGVLARTPVGLTAASSAAAVRAGIRRASEWGFIDQNGDPMTVVPDAKLDPKLEGFDRVQELGRSVIADVAAQLKVWKSLAGVPLDIHWVFPSTRAGMPSSYAIPLAADWGSRLQDTLRGIKTRNVRRSTGHAGVAEALHGINANDDAITLVLAADSYLHADTLAALEQQRLFGAAARSGFTPGEAAAALLIVPERLRRTAQLPCVAAIDGVGVEREGLLPDSDTGSFGVGLTQALRCAMAGRSLPAEAVADVYLDINGQRYRSEEWGFVALRFPSAFVSLDYHAPAGCWGDVGAATGALAIGLAAAGWARGYARGDRAAVLNGSDDGLRGAVVIRRPH